MTTSEASTASVVSTFGCWSEMSMPTSAMASTAAGLTRSPGQRPGRADLDGVAGQVPQPAGGHLRAAGVVHADEQHGRPGHGVSFGTTTASATAVDAG
jgi:hypothetical protein